jgi:hypothetical protein
MDFKAAFKQAADDAKAAGKINDDECRLAHEAASDTHRHTAVMALVQSKLGHAAGVGKIDWSSLIGKITAMMPLIIQILQAFQKPVAALIVFALMCLGSTANAQFVVTEQAQYSKQVAPVQPPVQAPAQAPVYAPMKATYAAPRAGVFRGGCLANRRAARQARRAGRANGFSC